MLSVSSVWSGRRGCLLESAPHAAAALLRAALSLWRGEPLADFTFEPFAQSEISRLTELRLTALEDRIEAELALGGHAALCGELARLVCEHPFRERLSGQLMVALYRCGRQAEALRVYADLRETLVEQLGVDPSPALVRLEEAILRQEPELDWPRILEPAAQRPVPVRSPPDRPTERSTDDLVSEARSAMRAVPLAGGLRPVLRQQTNEGPCAVRTSTRSPRSRSCSAGRMSRTWPASARTRPSWPRASHGGQRWRRSV